jgi:arsenate reductase
VSPAVEPAGPLVQIFGTLDSQPTRAALRFFKERRLDVHLVDIRRKPMAAGELRRFVERLGARTLMDETSKPYRDGGLAYFSMRDGEIAERLIADSRLIRLPLVRHGNDVTAGGAETTWTAWLNPSGGSATR